MDFLAFTRSINSGLADTIEEAAELKFDFSDAHDPEGYFANYRHHNNMVYFWFLEWAAEKHREIDLAYRCKATRFIIDRWKTRLRGYRPYHDTGFVLRIWETLAPKMEVLRNAPEHSRHEKVRKVQTLEEMWAPYEGRPWSSVFDDDPYSPLIPDNILKIIEKEAGSIGKPTARRLGVSVAELRRQIGNWDIGDQVNRIRKKHRRRSVRFVAYDCAPNADFRIYQEIWPPGYA